GLVHSYVHGGRIGVLVEVNCQTDFVARNADFQAFVNEVAMQIAAGNPTYVRREDIPAEDIAARREIFKAQLEEEERETGKKRPENVVEKIIEGKLEKWMKESCLLEQELMLSDDTDENFGTLTDKLSAKTGEKISIRRFVRYELGEGIEKKTANLAEEVAEQLKGN